MADKIAHRLHGGDMQAVEVQLDPGEGVIAEPGLMLFMDAGVAMHTTTGGGVVKGIMRRFSGESFFISSFINEGRGKQNVAFAAPYPGRIVPLNLNQLGGSVLVQKDAFLCAARGTQVEVAFTKKLGAALFGGEGWVLQRLKGAGMAFVHAGGTLIERELADGQVLKVDSGSLVGFTEGVDYTVEMVGGVRNLLFGGEGLWHTTLRGPGHVWLQTLPYPRLIAPIATRAAELVREEASAKG